MEVLTSQKIPRMTLPCSRCSMRRRMSWCLQSCRTTSTVHPELTLSPYAAKIRVNRRAPLCYADQRCSFDSHDVCDVTWTHVVHRVGMLFMPQDPEAAAAAATIVEKVVAAEGRCRIAGWRDVPHDDAVVGRMARAEQPVIRQVREPAPTLTPTHPAVQYETFGPKFSCCRLSTRLREAILCFSVRQPTTHRRRAASAHAVPVRRACHDLQDGRVANPFPLNNRRTKLWWTLTVNSCGRRS